MINFPQKCFSSCCWNTVFVALNTLLFPQAESQPELQCWILHRFTIFSVLYSIKNSQWTLCLSRLPFYSLFQPLCIFLQFSVLPLASKNLVMLHCSFYLHRIFLCCVFLTRAYIKIQLDKEVRWQQIKIRDVINHFLSHNPRIIWSY